MDFLGFTQFGTANELSRHVIMNKNPPIFVILNYGLLILCQIQLKSHHSCVFGLFEYETKNGFTNFRKMLF